MACSDTLSLMRPATSVRGGAGPAAGEECNCAWGVSIITVTSLLFIREEPPNHD